MAFVRIILLFALFACSDLHDIGTNVIMPVADATPMPSATLCTDNGTMELSAPMQVYIIVPPAQARQLNNRHNRPYTQPAASIARRVPAIFDACYQPSFCSKALGRLSYCGISIIITMRHIIR